MSGNANTRFHVRIDMDASYGPLLPAFVGKTVDSCFMLISPHTPYENWKRLDAVLSWLAQRSSRTVVVDGGYLDRWNIECIDGFPQAEAEALALKSSSRIERRVRRIIDDRRLSDRIEFWDYRLVLADSRFRESFCWLQDQLAEPAFANEIDEYVRSYVSRTSRTVRGKTLDVDRLRSYVLEEISLSMVLHAHGLPAECYAGSDFSIVERMTHGAFGPSPVDLSQRTFVSLIVEIP